MENAEKNFDGAGFYAALAATVAARNVSWRLVSKETGVSTTTLTRMAQGRRPDASSLASLSAWAGLNPADFVTLDGPDRMPEPLAQIGMLLRRDQRLKPDAAQAIELMIRTAYGHFRDAKATPAGEERKRSKQTLKRK